MATPLMLNGSVTARTGVERLRLADDDADAHAGQPVGLRERAADSTFG